jgi:predicted DNA-binding transcriptional regulator AlpA
MGTTSHSPAAADERLWTIHDIAAYLAVSRRTADKLVQQPGFPLRIRLSSQTHRWVPADVRRWARSRSERTPARLVDALR